LCSSDTFLPTRKPSIGVHQIGEDQWPYVILPWVHRIFSNLKVWALGVYHGLRRKHLQSYLDEFRLPLQPSPHKARRVPIPPRHRRRPPALNNTCCCRQSTAVSLWEYYSSFHSVLTGEHLDLQDVENRIFQRESRLEIHCHAWTGKGFRQMLDAVSDALEFVVLCHIFCGNGNIFVLERRPRSRHDCSRLITGPKRQKHANSGHASELSPARPSPAVALPNARRRSG